METLRTRIPHLIQMLMDKDVTLTFSGGFHGPTISYTYRGGNGGHMHLDTWYVPGSYGANAIEIERRLVEIFVELPKGGASSE